MVSTLLNMGWKSWVKFFVFCEFLIICMMLGTLGSKTWVYTRSLGSATNDDSDPYNTKIWFYNFEGNLYSCTRSCDKSYKYLKNQWCDFSDEFDSADESIYTSTYSEYTKGFMADSICKTFKALYNSMIIYLIIESLAISLVIAWLVLTILSIRFKIRSLIVFSVILPILSSCLHLGAFIAYMVITRTNFNLNCKYFPFYTGGQINLCAGHGAELALFISIFLPILTFSFGVVFYMLYQRKLSKTISKDKSDNV